MTRNLFLIAIMMVLIVIPGCGTPENAEPVYSISFFEGGEGPTIALAFTGEVKFISNHTGEDIGDHLVTPYDYSLIQDGERKALESVPNSIYLPEHKRLDFNKTGRVMTKILPRKNLLLTFHPGGSLDGNVQIEIWGGDIRNGRVGCSFELGSTEGWVRIGTLETGGGIGSPSIPFSLSRSGCPVLEVQQLPSSCEASTDSR